MPKPSKIRSTRAKRNLPQQDARALQEILDRNNVKDRMEAELFRRFKAGEKEQTIRNQMALIDVFFDDVQRAVTGFGTE